MFRDGFRLFLMRLEICTLFKTKTYAALEDIPLPHSHQWSANSLFGCFPQKTSTAHIGDRVSSESTKILWQKGSRFYGPTALLCLLVLMFQPLRCYTTGLPPTGLKQGRDCLQASGDTNWSSGPTSCMVQLHQ